MRFVSNSLAAFSVSISGAVFAQESLTIDVLTVNEDGTFSDPLSSDDRDVFFNRAQCLCNSPIGLEMFLSELPANTTRSDDVEIWVGSSTAPCDDVNERDDATSCESLLSGTTELGVLEDQETFPVSAMDIIVPGEGDCSLIEDTRKIFVYLTKDGVISTEDDMFDSVGTLDLPVDTDPPPAPEDVSAQGAEDAVKISWTLPESNLEDIAWFQVLCANSQNGEPLFDAPRDDAEYVVSNQLCEVADDQAEPISADDEDEDAGAGEDVDAGVLDAGVVDALGGIPDADTGEREDAASPTKPDASIEDTDAGSDVDTTDLNNLDPRYLCSDALIPGANSDVRIDLSAATNLDVAGGDEVMVRLLVIDRHGNATVVATNNAVPQPVQDFWEVYGAQGGGAEGGFCQIGRRGLGRWALTILGVLVVALSILRVGRSRLLLLLAFLSTQDALAQVVLDEELEEPDALESQFSEWAVEIKAGPYLPAIDGESGLGGSPYRETFGEDSASDADARGDRDPTAVLFQLEVDRFFLWPFGELGLGLSAGYMRESAWSFAETDGGAPDYNKRSDADRTAFHLMPTSVLAVYRVTALADNTYVPLVPYAKVGLSYYLWWVTKGDGSVTENETNGAAKGGTLGWQGALGVAARLDAVDARASQNLQADFGIEHASIFVEGVYADVSGLGADHKLRVGTKDVTWSMGLVFEF